MLTARLLKEKNRQRCLLLGDRSGIHHAPESLDGKKSFPAGSPNQDEQGIQGVMLGPRPPRLGVAFFIKRGNHDCGGGSQPVL